MDARLGGATGRGHCVRLVVNDDLRGHRGQSGRGGIGTAEGDRLAELLRPVLGVTLNEVMSNGSTCGPLKGTLLSGSCQDRDPALNWNVYVCGPAGSLVVAVYSANLPVIFGRSSGSWCRRR